ncbi:MAG: hypothetical protein Q4C48_05405 [Lachnospiraceae bacterium]|nr:hypothetical protein [Lachnospiraceae bacterium]
MLRNKLICLGLAILVIIGIFPEKVCGEAEAANVTWVETTYDSERRINVCTTSHTYFNNIKQGTNCWTAHRIDKGTWIGTIIMSVTSSRTESALLYTYNNGTSYGKTWGNSYDILITMQPQSYIKAKPYIGSSYNMTDAKVWVSGVIKTLYPASEDLVNWCRTRNTKSTGFLEDWSPRYRTDTSGWDHVDISFGVSVKEKTFNVSLGKTISVKDEFVKSYDKTDSSTGCYKTRYDYKKYNKLGYCSSDRKKRVFGNTTVHDSVTWRNCFKEFSGYVYATATFTVCDSKTWPTELVTASATITSAKMIIK